MQINHVQFCMPLDPSLTSAVLFPSSPSALDRSLGEDGWPSSAPRHPANRTLPVWVGLGWHVPVPFQLRSPVLSSVAHLLCSQGALKSSFCFLASTLSRVGKKACSGVRIGCLRTGSCGCAATLGHGPGPSPAGMLGLVSWEAFPRCPGHPRGDEPVTLPAVAGTILGCFPDMQQERAAPEAFAVSSPVSTSDRETRLACLHLRLAFGCVGFVSFSFFLL